MHILRADKNRATLDQASGGAFRGPIVNLPKCHLPFGGWTPVCPAEPTVPFDRDP
jgi:hypothetical protein